MNSFPSPVRHTAMIPFNSSLASRGTASRCSSGEISVPTMVMARGIIIYIIDDLAHLVFCNTPQDPCAEIDRIIADVFRLCAHRGNGAECISIPFGQEEGAQVTVEQIPGMCGDPLQHRRCIRDWLRYRALHPPARTFLGRGVGFQDTNERFQSRWRFDVPR